METKRKVLTILLLRPIQSSKWSYDRRIEL